MRLWLKSPCVLRAAFLLQMPGRRVSGLFQVLPATVLPRLTAPSSFFRASEVRLRDRRPDPNSLWPHCWEESGFKDVSAQIAPLWAVQISSSPQEPHVHHPVGSLLPCKLRLWQFLEIRAKTSGWRHCSAVNNEPSGEISHDHDFEQTLLLIFESSINSHTGLMKRLSISEWFFLERN